MNNREQLIREVSAINPACAKQISAILNCKAHFCRITMKPQPSDMEKRNGERRVFRVNPRAVWKHYETKHLGGDGKLTESGLKGIATKLKKSCINIVESVRPLPQGGTICQCRTLNIPLIDEIKCGKAVYKF